MMTKRARTNAALWLVVFVGFALVLYLGRNAGTGLEPWMMQ